MLRSGEGVTTGSSYCTGDSGKLIKEEIQKLKEKGLARLGSDLREGFRLRQEHAAYSMATGKCVEDAHR